MIKKFRQYVRFVWLVLAACASPVETSGDGVTAAAFSATPISDMSAGLYLGQYSGLLYDDSNQRPYDHLMAGLVAAQSIVPRTTSGAVNTSTGKIVAVTIGFSNFAHETCAKTTRSSNPACTTNSFIYKATASPLRKSSVVIFPGAMASQTNPYWDSPTDSNYDTVKVRLVQKGYSEAQVQVVLLKVANVRPTVSLPDPNADAYQIVGQAGNIIRALKVRYPNLKQVFVYSRIYGGYATTLTNPEPYAYEGGFAVKWLIKASIYQRETGIINVLAGDLSGVWIDWGTYLWASGATPRSDGLEWTVNNFIADGTHPSTSGVNKVSNRMLTQFTTDTVYCWFRVSGC